jgi:hypothetical protein
MERYLVQCADEAFKTLAGDGEWETRLADAKSRLFTSDHATANATQTVKEPLAEVKSANTPPELSNALRRAITTIVEECVRQGLM